MGTAMVVVVAVILGFLAGLLSFRQKSRWCPGCGATFSCPDAQCRATSGTSSEGRRDPAVCRTGPSSGGNRFGRTCRHRASSRLGRHSGSSRPDARHARASRCGPVRRRRRAPVRRRGLPLRARTGSRRPPAEPGCHPHSAGRRRPRCSPASPDSMTRFKTDRLSMSGHGH